MLNCALQLTHDWIVRDSCHVEVQVHQHKNQRSIVHHESRGGGLVSMDDEILTTLKILIIGESGVGKSSLLLRFSDDSFDPSQALTIGVDFRTKKDTAGQERFRTLTPSYYRDAQGAILVFDVTNRKSFEKLETWLNELDTYATKSSLKKMVVGNKTDMSPRQVSREEGSRFARRNATFYMETSAKENVNVVNAFEDLVAHIIQTPGLWERQESDRIRVSSSDSSNDSWWSFVRGWC
ncbi:unnamed protein product [Bemisia tabaci]|uniref:Uncharacterized protein n=1 Tax=Bemisia tabaci TaxID=7038 RepID=A0A9P0A9F8_BEMTA|nr:unnamed protein product [Bemisia tabaci]